MGPRNFAMVCDAIVNLTKAPTLDGLFSPSPDLKTVSYLPIIPVRIRK